MIGDRLEELLRTLLYEGYALFPYTPGAAKNATPTPFGIVYPPAYAAAVPTAHDHLRLCGIVRLAGPATVAADVRFLVPVADGHAHSAAERRLELGPLPLGTAASVHADRHFDLGPVRGRMRLRVEPAGDGLARVAVCIHNETALAPDAGDRATALRASLLSTHPLLRVSGGRFAVAARARRRRRRRGRRRARASTPSRSSPPTRTTCCSAPPWCCPITRSWRRRAAATCSTARRSRRRCCSTCSR